MNDNAIKGFAIWAHDELEKDVRLCAAQYGIDAEGVPAPDALAVGERALTEQERAQRAELLRDLHSEKDFQDLVDRAAYTWFNRLVAIRYMEVNDRLPSHVRVLSAPDGSFAPEALGEALDLPLEALDASEAARLMQAGDDEALFRLIFLAQCDELADCMPAVFDHIGGAMELLLPRDLLRHGGVVERLVEDIPEDDWREGVEIVGWLYQYYVAEEKDEVFAGFKKGRKADARTIRPATQLFTPDWIVKYMVQNSLGRLWMLNHPESPLAEGMEYYVRPDEEHEAAFRRISSPEEITVIDPACGSGHILDYAFDLLAQMYEEAGYTPRDAARLIVEKNLAGLEIDPRAAALASFTITMKACEHDARFLRRGVAPKVGVLKPVRFADEELALCPSLAARRGFVDAVAHLDECGSLLRPEADDLIAIKLALTELRDDDTIFAGSAREKLEALQEELEPLVARYDVVVANPPYMGSKNMGSWLGKWVKKQYPDESRDLFSCFMVRNLALGADHAQLGFMTPNVWMFIGSYEKLRRLVAFDNTITSLVQLSNSGFTGATVFVCALTVQKDEIPGYQGGYVRLTDFSGADNQAPKTREAIANPDDCSWFYRADASNFSAIPGIPIAYWASESTKKSFLNGERLGERGKTSKGLITGDNDAFLRLWWECQSKKTCFYTHDIRLLFDKSYKWFACTKGGPYKKWAGNLEWVVNWTNNGNDVKQSAYKNRHHFQDYDDDLKFKTAVTWSAITSGRPAFRYVSGVLSEHAGMCDYLSDETILYVLAFLNSSVSLHFLSLFASTMNVNAGDIDSLPLFYINNKKRRIEILSEQCIRMAKEDWDSQETSWNYQRHPLAI